MNQALGANILWSMITGKLEWCKSCLHKKYLKGSRKRCLDNPLPKTKGYLICMLLKVVAPLIQSKMTWYLGNQKTILV